MRNVPISATLAVVALALGGCPAPQSSMPPLPQVELGDYAPAVRAQIERARARAASGPADSAASGELGMILHAYGLFDAANDCYARARALDPADFHWPWYQALVLEMRGRSADALDALVQATRLKPGARDAQLELARLLRGAGRTEDSRARLADLVAYAPDDAEAQFELGRTLLELGDVRGAIDRLDRAVQLAGDRGDVHYALALAYQRLGDATQAEAHFAAHERFQSRPLVLVTALPPEIAQLDLGLQAAVRHERARRLALAGDFAGALALADEDTRTAPWAEYALALRQAHTGQPLAALPLLQRARSHAEQAGDVELVAAIDVELRRGLAALTP
jgi:Flp pilus assembly protein TadD